MKVMHWHRLVVVGSHPTFGTIFLQLWNILEQAGLIQFAFFAVVDHSNTSFGNICLVMGVKTLGFFSFHGTVGDYCVNESQNTRRLPTTIMARSKLKHQSLSISYLFSCQPGSHSGTPQTRHPSEGGWPDIRQDLSRESQTPAESQDQLKSSGAS